MTTNEIKKALLKQSPVAKLVYITNGAIYYSTTLESHDAISFKIPMEETSGGYFYSDMPAKALLRWIEIEQQLELDVE